MIIIDDVFDAHAAHDNHETVSESTCLLARARDRSEEAALDNLVLFYCPSTFIAHGELLRHYRRHLSEPSEAKQGDSCARNGHARGSHARGSHARGSHARGSHARGSHARGSEATGSHPRGSHARGSHARGSHARGSHARGSHARGSHAR